ncbi:hypothetical protein ACF3MZ_21400 [Paenibacillaceae bacterium WGS1546]|uniref:hypothetical protein n=1 Tax=Cohnella sp. WGS1546 TaxID=3366810 RepID=UPI00372D0B3B
MRTYIVRFHHPDYGSAFAEVVAGSHFDAESDFEARWPCRIISIHEKPAHYGP